jgi:hypothetical protein
VRKREWFRKNRVVAGVQFRYEITLSLKDNQIGNMDSYADLLVKKCGGRWRSLCGNGKNIKFQFSRKKAACAFHLSSILLQFKVTSKSGF